MERFIRIFFLLILALFISSASGQTSNDVNSTGASATNTSVGGGQSNLLGSNIGTQQNSTNVTGGYGNVNSNNPGTTTAKVYSVPTMYAPGLTAAGSDVCLGSVSASGSILGLGLAGGGTYVDDNCVLLKNSQRMAALGFGNAAVVMMLQNKDIEKAIRTSSPTVYLQVSKDRLANLQAEFDDAKEMGESTVDLEEKLIKANKEVRIMARRVQTSPGMPEKVVEIAPTTSGGKAKTANDPREILNP
ncbi:hypothetical protein [Polynucleobacter asymbioticus]|uniref:Uncharacterized protein n=1 Tax=Polynucleobacter asymbioticus (strain DSM 18221 / CIP 109841 / QLW-P1DMWA-1) TaxID=312153 RepID=A4SWE2_POLAQ|nr:hypothetical protein [Polynucleobacter asymbioticus]ABP33806.1 hypothetical protein Pnuc_0588 [Polynucleobacter asymbioticus QLW-P1DMWA-1]APC05614.1 hypothetical protein AOC10_03200 [Polynucleobacter asymbioticus]